MAAIVISHLSKTFSGPVRAVDDLCLDVGEHELLVLMGPSGCGKTTTLRMIAGLERPTSGQIFINGDDVGRMSPRQRNVAMVFQQHALYPHLSVRGNLAFGLKLRGTPRGEIAKRVDEAAAALAIGDLFDRRPGELSHGQQQRVALGRAIARRPQLFLLDEPLSSLDAPLRRQLRQEIRRLHQRLGVSMIYVTHDPAEALALGQRIAVLRDGRLQQAADPQTIYDRPANRFVAEACGNPGMSFLICRVQAAGESLSLVLSEGTILPLPSNCRDLLARYAGKSILLGVRPEHLRLSTEYSVLSTQYSVPNTQCSVAESRLEIPATVAAVERLGAVMHVHLSLGAESMIARAEGNIRLTEGENVVAVVLSEHLRFFDAATEQAL